VTLACAIALLVLLIYVFTILINTGVWHYYEQVDAGLGITGLVSYDPQFSTHTEQVQRYYGSIAKTMATLFESITGGDWTVMAEPVCQLSWTFYAIWYSYTGFVTFGLLNVFTGIFVESATHAANADREIVMQAQMEEESSYLNQIRVIFKRVDADNSGNMTETELVYLFEQEDFKEQMQYLGIHPTEAAGLFKLLDDDQSGSVSIEEFLSGCIRLKGQAKAVDMITLLFETNKINHKVAKTHQMVSDLIESLDSGSEDVFQSSELDRSLQEPGSRDVGSSSTRALC